ncbi:ice-binding family protein [Dyadobacter sp. NIV53]|uniref:ice-binding family protein n=1 Tax=Dyadobacter sp. NIV53 TaxID=2861765 RepID=UPI001C85D74C|nr:ice-binding family protein [Dyadobacter sp. NIV53]
MSKNLLSVVAIIISLFSSDLTFGQSPTAPSLGTATGFALFTGAGLVTNLGATTIVGDVGTNQESYVGFATVTQLGTRYNPGSVTATVAADVISAYNNLQGRINNSVLTSPLQTLTPPLTPQIYYLGGAATLTGDLILDAGDDADAVFIIQINGALTTSPGSRVILQNGALPTNVYWQISGSVELGIASAFSGTIVAAGAINLLQGATLTGKGLTTTGAININNNTIVTVLAPLPVTLTYFTAKKGENQTAMLSWATTAETNSDRFEIEHSVNGKSWKNIATVAAKGESSALVSYLYSDLTPKQGSNFYRLKMIDSDATFAYSRIQNVEIGMTNLRTVLYPNPAFDKLTLDVDDINQIERVQLNDILGKVVYDQSRTSLTGISANVDMNNLSSGMYIARITRAKGAVTLVKILKQ